MQTLRLAATFRQVTDESPAESEPKQSQSTESEDEASGDGIQWLSDDFDELEDDEDALSGNEGEHHPTPSNPQPMKKLKPVSQNKVAQSREATWERISQGTCFLIIAK